uniref:Uncharacterized protein n=1 Tax=Chenopodium quinoa TaxID=63459 RepID=A0A803LQ85_CHEQI
MAFLLSVARNLRLKLNTKPNYPFKKRGFKVVVGERNDESGEEQEQVVEVVPLEKWFWKFKEDYLDNSKYENAMDGFMRNAMRLTADQRTHEFAALDSLLGKNLTWLQLVLVDDKRSIQGNLYSVAARVFPNSLYVAENSRQLFREAAPYFLHDTEQWVFSRSFVLKEYNGTIHEEALEFPGYDPLGGLDKLHVDMPYDIRCTEVFMFIAGDYAVEERGLSSHEAVQRLLYELNTAEGIRKIHGFYLVSGSAKVSPEKLAVLKNMHISI